MVATAPELEALYRRHGPVVYRRCLLLLKDKHDAMDAMQDVFAQCVRYGVHRNARAPAAMLHRIATNVCLNRLRGRRDQTEPINAALQAIADAPDPESSALARSIVARLFRRAPASTRVIAVLSLVDGMTHAEVAREVGLSVSGVRKRLRTFLAGLSLPEVP